MERYLTFGVPYCSGLPPPNTPRTWPMARNMGSYLATVGTTATDPQARIVRRPPRGRVQLLPLRLPRKAIARQSPPPPPKPGDPPFALMSPPLGKVPDAEQETAADLTVRYDTDVARSAAAWTNAEKLRLSLVQRGMTLNAQTQGRCSASAPLRRCSRRFKSA